MDEHTPIEVPIRLEAWDYRHGETAVEVETIMVNIRPILDVTDADHLPQPNEMDADYISEDAQRLGLLKLWDGPSTVELEECEEYPDYLKWRETHRTVEGARERFIELSKLELRRRIEETRKQLDEYVRQYDRLNGSEL